MVQLSIIIVNYNVRYFLEQCLISVLAACKHISYEIIVIDNNSIDSSCAMIQKKFPLIRLIENKKNVGFSKANNQGVNIAKGEFVLILNPDTVLPENLLDDLMLFAEKKKQVGAIGVRFIDGAGNFLPECKRNIPTVETASRKLMGDSKKYYASQIMENEVSEVEILTGAFMWMRREVYLKVGGFDEDYFMFGEDIDLSYKLLNRGYQNYYYGKSAIIHYKGESTVKDRAYLKNFYGAMQIFYKKHFKSNIISSLLLNNALKSLVFLKSKKPPKEKFEKDVEHVLFISEDTDKRDLLKLNFDPGAVSMMQDLPKDVSIYDIIIFDNAFMTFENIILKFQELKAEEKLLRIIPKNSTFFIGSDSSQDRGVYMNFTI